MKLLLPVRLNFLGGWSDQEDWPERGAVVNASVGWYGPGSLNDDPYPCVFDKNGFRTKVEGVGSGLGISSIRLAARIIYSNPYGMACNWVRGTLEAECKEGTRGGWQDQIGAIEGGVKLVRLAEGDTGLCDPVSAGILDMCVLFDTGLRRPSKLIGDKVRSLFHVEAFKSALRQNVEDARRAPKMSAMEIANASIEGWKRLLNFVPEMHVPMPYIYGTLGWMLTGSGGGGFGVYFTENREEVVEQVEHLGYKAYLPVPLDGLKKVAD